MSSLIKATTPIKRTCVPVLVVALLSMLGATIAYGDNLDLELSIAAHAAEQLDERWSIFSANLDNQLFAEASDDINQLVIIRDAAGIDSLPEFALALASLGQEADRTNQHERAKYLFRWALKLASEDPEVIWAVIPYCQKYHLGSFRELAQRALLVTIKSRARLIFVLESSASLLLMALTWTLFLSLVVIITSETISLFRVLAAYMSSTLRGVVMPFVFLLLFVTPLFFGLLACIGFWSIAILLLLPEHRKFTLYSGIVILCWGVITPFSANISLWREDANVQRVLLRGDQPLKLAAIAPLATELERWRDNPIVQFKFAQLLRRSGDKEKAKEILIRLEQQFGESASITAERATIYSIDRDFTNAVANLESAIAQGNESAAVLFNLSKAVFELEDTKRSRDLFGQALRKDKQGVERLRKREEVLGIHDPRAFADVDLPMTQYLIVNLASPKVTLQQAQNVASTLSLGMSPNLTALAGVVIFVLQFMWRKTLRRYTFKSLFSGQQQLRSARLLEVLIPGGVLLPEKRFRSGLIILLLMVLAGYPLLSGSYTSASTSAFAWLQPYHACLWLGSYLTIALWSTRQRGV